MSRPSLQVRRTLRTAVVIAPLLGAGCAPERALPRCPDTTPLAFSLSCEPLQLAEACRPPELQAASLMPLASGLPSVEFAPLADGLLVLQVDGAGALTATRFDGGAAQVGTPEVLDAAAGELVALRLLPRAGGFSVHALRLEGPGRHALLQLTLDAEGRPSQLGLSQVWAFDEPEGLPVSIRWGASAEGTRVLALVGRSKDGLADQELWAVETRTDAALDAEVTPFLVAGASLQGPLAVRPGDVLGHPGGGYVVAGVDGFGELGEVWVRTVPDDVELWRSAAQPAPEQASLLLEPAPMRLEPTSTVEPRFSVGWYSPGRVDQEFAFVRRATELGGSSAPWETGIQYGAWYGAGGLGRVLQTLAVHEERLVQVTFEASPATLPGTELAELFAYDGLYSFGPFHGRNLVPSWPGFDTLRAVESERGALVTAIPIMTDAGALSLGLYRMCL